MLQTRHIIVIFLFLCLGFGYLYKLQKADAPDFQVFYTAAKHAVHSPEKIYTDSPDRFLYPPVAALLFVPFTIFPSWEANKLLWYGFSLAIMLALSWPSWLHFLAIIILLRYFLINLHYGQINIAILGLMLITHFSLLKKKPFLAGFSIALGSILKIFPAIQIIEFFFKKNWRSIGIAAAAFFIFLALPFLFWPFTTVTSLYAQYPLQLQDKGLPLYSHNQSLAAFLMRLFGGTSFDLFSIGQTANWTIYLIREIYVKGLAFLIGLGLSFFTWKKAFKRNSELDYLSATFFSILFLSHIVWKPYFIFLYAPLIQVLPQMKVKSKQGIFFILFLLLGPLSSPDLLGKKCSIILDSLSIHWWGAIIIFILWIKIEKAELLRPFPSI